MTLVRPSSAIWYERSLFLRAIFLLFVYIYHPLERNNVVKYLGFDVHHMWSIKWLFLEKYQQRTFKEYKWNSHLTWANKTRLSLRYWSSAFFYIQPGLFCIDVLNLSFEISSYYLVNWKCIVVKPLECMVKSNS